MAYNDLIYNRYKLRNKQGYRLIESITDKSAGNKLSILKLGKIPMYVESLDKIVDVELKKIVQSVDSALGKIGSKYSFMYTYLQHCRPMFVIANPADANCIHKTFSIDNLGNLWMNVYFIYNELDCDVNKIFGILFHELMHNFLNHIQTSLKILPFEDRVKLKHTSSKLYDLEMAKQNICADMEVNCNMVADGVVTEDFWKEMHGIFDKEYYGRMYEDIYEKDGDKLLKRYMSKKGEGVSPEYLEALKAIFEALKVLRDPEATERDKDIAATKLRDIIEKLFGESKTKMTIRKRLKKLQKTQIKEIGEIGPYLKKVIDDLDVSPINMTDEDLDIFVEDVNTLKEEMKRCVTKISEKFTLDEEVFLKDNEECWTLLIDGVTRLNKEKELTFEQRDEISEKIIYSIGKLIADNLKKNKLKEEFEKRMKEIKERKKKKVEKIREEKRKKHILYNYWLRVEDMAAIYYHGRLDEKSFELCNEYAKLIKKLLDKDIHEINEDDVSGMYPIIENLKETFYENLKNLKEQKILIDRDDSFFVDLVDRFYEETKYMLDYLKEEHTETEIVSVVKIALSSWRRIGREFHRQQKIRPSEEYKKAYYDEYKRLYKVWEELGEKGLKRELGIPIDEEE